MTLEGQALSIRPPAGAVVARERTGETVNLVMADRKDDPRWRVRIQSLEADPSTPTSKAIAQDHLNRLQTAGEPFEILAFEPARWGGTKGDLLVVEQTLPDESRTVNGWLVLPRGDLLFTVITLATTREHVLDARAALESSLATLTLTDMEKVYDQRAAMLSAGEAFIRTLTPEKLRTLVGLDEWFRLYRPGAEGAPERELGYVHLRVVEGLQGELEPSRRREDLRGDEAEPGLMLIARARGLTKEDGSELLDIEARYWMAWDRSSEAWSSRSTERKGRSMRSFAQTGVRPPARGGQPPTLTVLSVRTDLGRDHHKPSQMWDLPRASYLSVPEAMLLGWLLPRDKAEPSEYAFFAFDTKEARLPIRLETWSPILADPASDGLRSGGRWELVTRPAMDEAASRQVFDDKGRVRLVDADGAHSERTTLPALLQLWKSKGLPTGEEKR